MINDPTLPGGGDDAAEIVSAATVAENPPGGGDPPTNGTNGGSGGRDDYDGPKIDISEEMRSSYLGYAMSTIVSRALPDVRDGLKPVQRRILYAMRELGLSPNSRHLKSAKVVGECFVAGTRVSTPSGLVAIEELSVGDEVYTQTGLRRVTETYILPEQPLLEVELSSGSRVVCTPGQMFKTLAADLSLQWKRADEIAAGDHIALRDAAPERLTGASNVMVGEFALDADLAYLLGFFLADGWVDRDRKCGYDRLSFATSDLPIAERLQGILADHFDLQVAITQRDNMHYLRVNDSAWNRRFLEAFELGDKYCHTIRVPEAVFRSRPEVALAFVSGFADGDGSVHKTRNILALTSICHPFLHDLGVLLQGLGIYSRLVPYDKVGGRAEYGLEIGSGSLMRLAGQLILTHPVKKARLAACAARSARVQPEKSERLPFLGQKILEEFQEKHLGGGWYAGPDGAKVRSGLTYADGTKFRYHADIADTFELSYPLLETLGIEKKMAAIGSVYLPLLQAWKEQRVRFGQVRRVRAAAAEVTYDIQVEEEHEFIANGMLVHNCMGNYHPHGDQALYGTMVRMAQPFSLRYPLVDGQGNFGSVDDDPPAAMRYTEARLTALAMEMMEDIEKDTVDFIPTYDNERREPSVLPGKFPNLICNGSTGIAVGMATNMPPHNLREVVDAAAYLLEHGDATMEDLMRFIPGPDFPTHGLILGTKGIKAAYATGRGSVTMQAKTTIEPMDNGKSAIVISELPYQVIKKKLIEDIAELVKEKKVEGITNVNDYSDKTGMRVVVELRRDVMPQKVLNYLLKHTNLRLNFGVILLSLVDNGRGPRTLPLRGLLQEYLDHRRIIITRRTRFELGRAKARAHILEGLQIAVQFLDEVIAIIRASNTTEIARTRLIERFAFSGIQADSILNMQLRQLTGLEQEKIENEYKDLLKEIARLEDILSDPRRVDALVKADLKYLRDKFGDDRRTRIIPTEAEEINIEDLIADEEMLITITRDGYIRRLPADTFPTQGRGGKGRIAGKTKEEDNFEHFFRASTHDYILFFTDRGRVYRLKAFEVPQTSRQAMGTAIINLIQIQSDERITATVPIRDLRAAQGYLLMATERGEVKRTEIADYVNLRANGLITFDLEPNDALKWVKHTNGEQQVLMTTIRGMAIRFPETDVPSRGRAAGGVRGVTLDGPRDRVVAVDLAPLDSEVLVVSDHGYGKRTALAEYRIQSRGGKGIKTMDLTDKTGVLVAACVLTKESIGDQRLVMVTDKGIGIRIRVGDVRVTTSRSAQGVKLIELAEGDHVKTVECIDVSKKDPDAAE